MFVTYENRANPHVRVHRPTCGHLRKNGGEHRYGQGGYVNHPDLARAVAYARATRLPFGFWKSCRPEREQR